MVVCVVVVVVLYVYKTASLFTERPDNRLLYNIFGGCCKLARATWPVPERRQQLCCCQVGVTSTTLLINHPVACSLATRLSGDTISSKSTCRQVALIDRAAGESAMAQNALVAAQK